MTKEEYLQQQQELRDRRCAEAARHREVMDEIERKYHENMHREGELYRMAKRTEKDAYDRTYQSIEQEAMALKAAWMDEHKQTACPLLAEQQSQVNSLSSE